MAMPPPVVHSGALHGAAAALQEAVKEAPWEPGTGLTVGRRREPSAREVGPVTARGVAVQHLQPEELHGRDRREPAVAPSGGPDLLAHRPDGFGWQPRGPLGGEALEDRGDGWNHRMPSCMIRMLLTHPYRRGAETPNRHEISGHTACVLPNLMPFGSPSFLVNTR